MILRREGSMFCHCSPPCGVPVFMGGALLSGSTK
jgi:hypothetical protein